MRFLIFLLFFVAFFQANSQTCDLNATGFETGSEPAGWVRAGSYIGTLAPFEGVYHAGFNTLGDILQVAPVNCPGEICYYWRCSGSTSDFDLSIEWSDNNGISWNTAFTHFLNGSSSPTTYAKNCVDIPENLFSNSNNVLIRFHQIRRTGGSFYLDSVCVSSGVCTITPKKVLFTSSPIGCIEANKNFSVTVCATDSLGNIDTSYSSSITLQKDNGLGVLSGTLNKIPINGCAIFDSLQVNIEDVYSIIASSGSLDNDTLNALNIMQVCPLTDTLTIMQYNLLFFPNGENFCGGGNIQLTNRIDTLKKILQYVNPDILMVCELQDAAGADLILNNALNVNGITKYAKANFVLNTSSTITDINNAFFYNSEKVALKSQSEIKTDLRDIGEYIVYGLDPNLSTNHDTTFIDFYETHFKAGSNASDSLRRIIEADSLRKHIDLKPSARNNIFGGDLNLNSAFEEAYQVLCYSGTYPFNDPINKEGIWSNNSFYADIHTQSTRFSQSIECGATGGMDDRLDFILVSDSIITGGNRVRYIPNSYSALGNNGSTYNNDINSVSNTSLIPDSILQALYFMSDHLPIIMDVEISYPQSILSLQQTIEQQKNASRKPLIYPNPAKINGEINIQIDNSDFVNEVYISDVYGKVLFYNKLQNQTSKILLNLNNFKSGIYSIKIIGAYENYNSILIIH